MTHTKMRRRRFAWTALALALLVPALVPSPAHADVEAVVPISEPEPVDFDPNKPLEYNVVPVVTIGTSQLPLGTESAVDDPATVPDELSTQLGTCKQVWVRIDYKYRDHTAFYFKQTKNWCWDGRKKITSVGVSSSGHVYSWATPVWSYDGVIGSTNYYYDNGRAHYSFREGKFSASCWGVSCGTRTPEIIIRVHGGGTWSYWTRG